MAVLKKLKRHIDKKTTFWPPDQNLLQQQQQPLILSKPSASYGKQEAASSKELGIMQKGKEKRENKVRQNNSRDDMITGTSSDRGLQKAKQVDMSSKNPRGEDRCKVAESRSEQPLDRPRWRSSRSRLSRRCSHLWNPQ
jgi:hypothetical protein